MDKPRQHHYVFAHIALPSLFYDNPSRFLTTLAHEGNNFLHLLWNKVGEGVDASERIAGFGLRSEMRELPDSTAIATITLPPPQGMTEAYFTAACYRPGERKGLFARGKPVARYITLEYSLDFEQEPRTVLGEWTPTHAHHNYGDGSEATLDAFFERVYDLLSQPQ